MTDKIPDVVVVEVCTVVVREVLDVPVVGVNVKFGVFVPLASTLLFNAIGSSYTGYVSNNMS